MTSVALDGALSRAAATAVRHAATPSNDNTTLLEDALLALLRLLPSVDPTARLSMMSPSVRELLEQAPAILSSHTTVATTRSKFHRLLFNIALYNIPLRRYLSGETELCGAVFHCLKLSLKEQLGPQNMIDILRLMQVLTYERCLLLGIWTNDLISFLMSEVNRDDEMEWMPYCIAILCNLASRSKSVCSRIKKSTSYKVFCRRVLKLLSHDSRIVVVSALVLVGYLEEKIRDVVYCPQNIRETFVCVFNILIMGDEECLMTRQIASDLLRRLVVSDAPTVSSVPVISSTGKDVMNYPFFENCIQRTAELLVTLDARLEESVKIYDLFLSFCTLQQLRAPVCSAIIGFPPSEARLTTPLLAVAATAAMPAERAIDPTIPIKAMKMLTQICKELVDSNGRIAQYLSTDQLINIIDTSVKSSVETAKETSLQQCQLIVEGLRLAEVCCQDEEVRAELLLLLSAALCSHVAEFQLLTNPIVIQMQKPPTARTESVPEWSIHGVSIVLQLIRLLAVLKDYSKPHKVQYWNSLKDDRLVPFLAYAISYGDHDMVHDALLLYTHCSQSQSFNSKWLGDLVASCVIAKRFQVDMALSNSMNSSKEIRRCSPEHMEHSGHRSPDVAEVPPLSRQDSRALEELLLKIKNGGEIKDLKMSDVLTAYDKKISMLQARERELELMVSSADRLRVQLRNGAGSSESDMARIRGLVTDVESLTETNRRLTAELDAARRTADEHSQRQQTQLRTAVAESEAIRQLFEQTKAELERSEATAKRLGEDFARMRMERDGLTSEIDQERELVMRARSHAEEQTRRLEIASMAVNEKSREVEALTKSLGQVRDDLVTLGRKHDVDTELWRKKNNELQNELDSMRCHGQKTQADLEKMRKLREEMLRLAGNYE